MGDFHAFSTHRNAIEKCLVSQVIVAVVAVKTRILTAFCQLEFVCLSLRNNYYCNFDEPSENYSRNLRLGNFHD